MSEVGSIASPCTGICTLSETSGLCVGCLRTPQEIGAWSTASRDDKLAILDRLEKRRLDRELGKTSSSLS